MITKKIFRKIKNNWLLLVLIFTALGFRIYFVDKYTNVSGDLLLHHDWGEKYWEYGSKNFYYVKNWYFAPPNYPPLINLYYAYSYKFYELKFYLAKLHNLMKIPPAFFIIYYYKWGYFFNLKLLSILADILLAFLIYKESSKIFRKRSLSLISLSIFLFNPTTILISSVWGQTDSVIALLSLISFLLLLRKKFVLSSILFTASLLFKPNWAIFLPFYLFLYFRNRPSVGSILFSFFSSSLLAIACALPFNDSPINFYVWLLKERIYPTLKASPVASVSAFNFYTTLLRIDYHSSNYKILDVPVKFYGYAVFVWVYSICLLSLYKRKINSQKIFASIIAIGLSWFLFFPGMLERYFFATLAPLAILSIKNRGFFIINKVFFLTFFLNILWAFFRRSNGEIDKLLTKNDFFLIRILSFANIVSFLFLMRLMFKNNLLKLILWKRKTNSK